MNRGGRPFRGCLQLSIRWWSVRCFSAALKLPKNNNQWMQLSIWLKWKRSSLQMFFQPNTKHFLFNLCKTSFQICHFGMRLLRLLRLKCQDWIQILQRSSALASNPYSRMFILFNKVELKMKLFAEPTVWMEVAPNPEQTDIHLAAAEEEPVQNTLSSHWGGLEERVSILHLRHT